MRRPATMARTQLNNVTTARGLCDDETEGVCIIALLTNRHVSAIPIATRIILLLNAQL